MGGTLDPDDVSRMALRDRIVIYVPGAGALPSRRATQVTRALRLAAPKAVLLISDLEPETFASRIPRVMPARTTVDLRLASPPFLELNEAAVAPVLRAAGVDLGATRADTAPVFRELPALRRAARAQGLGARVAHGAEHRRASSRAATRRSSASTWSSRRTWTTSASRRACRTA